MAEWVSYRERCKQLEAQLADLKQQPATNEQTVAWLLDAAEAFLRAAKTVLEIATPDAMSGAEEINAKANH